MPPRPPRYESLDVWRGVACLAVVLFHATSGYVATPDLEARVRAGGGDWADWLVVGTARLWLGVPLFFVISGYCIAAAADATRSKPHPGWTFLYRRFRRIYPPLWAYLAVAAAVVAVVPDAFRAGPPSDYPNALPHPAEVHPAQWVGSVTLTEEWRHHVGGPPRGYFTGQLWTLCYEEQFYLVVGVVVLLARRWLFPVLAVVTALVFLNVADLTAMFGPDLGGRLNAFRRPLPGCFFDGMWLAFAAGVAVYYRTAHASPLLRRCLDAGLVCGLLWAGKYVPSGWAFKPLIMPSYVAPAFVFALLLAWLRPLDARLAAAPAAAPLRFCGRMCYSLYLVHAPVAELVQWNLYRAGFTSPSEGVLVILPAATAASLALGYGFYRLVEVRFLNGAGQPEVPLRPAGSRHENPPSG